LPCVIINSEGVILDLNPLFNEALQYGYSDMINKKLELFFAQDSERITSFLKYHKNFQQLNEQNDLKIKRRDGSLVDCRIFYTKIEDDIFLVFLHLTNLQRYLTGTSVNKEADFSNRLSSIQEITGEISMGFSSFIYLIDGYTEFLTKSRDLTQIEKQRLNQLLSLISKIHSFIEKLLIFSERKYFEQDELEVLSILKKTADEVFSGFSSYKLNIPDEKVFIRGNSQSVKNMFVDIFSFICSSIGDKGQVELNSVIEFNPVEMNGLGIATDNKFLLISLRERGFRIPGEILPKIF
jgi:nitrogen-specific signal transduction histidine kinase